MQSSTSDRTGFEAELAATDRPLSDFGLWLGLLGPPALWLIQFQIVYALVLPVCVSHHKVILFFIPVLFAVGIVVCGIIGWNHRAPASGFPARIRSARGFMGVLSLMSMCMFLLVVIAQAIATVMHSPCPI
jgi:hypothetical protein